MKKTVSTILRLLAAPLVVLVLASTPLMFMPARGIPTFSPGLALDAIGSWFDGLATGESFNYTLGQTSWRLLDTAPRFLAVSFLYVAIPGALGLALGMALGLRARGREGGMAAHALDTLYAIPDFILALLLQLAVLVCLDLTGFKLGRISYDATGGTAMLLPFIMMSFYPFAYSFRVSARKAKDAAAADFTTYARAKGLSERAIRLRHVGAAVVPSMEAELPSLLALMQTNLFMAEYLFSLPGITRLLFTAAFPGRNLQMTRGYQYPLAVAVLLGILAVYGASWLFFRGALGLVRRGLTGER